MPSIPSIRAGLPLLPIAPVIVVVVGLTTAVMIALLGIAQLQQTSDAAMALRAKTLSATLAARLRSAPSDERVELLGRAARRSGAEVLLVDQEGHVLRNESYAIPTKEEVLRLLAAGTGEGRTALGRARFAVSALPPPRGSLSVVAFVAAPSPPPGSIALVKAVAALTSLLLGIAVAVALSYTKAVRDDVDYVRQRIVDMARPHADPAGEPVPIRSLDQVGVLTAAFNVLVQRFAAAERTYHADLRQAAEGDRERSAFLAGLSHELRTPLNAILGFAHVLASEVEGPLGPDALESLRVIETSGEHLKTLIDDVLDLSALETGQLKLSRRPVDLRRLAEQVVHEASATVRDRPLRLTVTGSSGQLAYVDARRVRQILTNLTANAIKATAQGTVAVSVEGRGAFIAVVVQDTGAGISPEEQAAIFEAYRQSGDARSRRGGAGLGLSIAQRLVRMHGGAITLESELGRGSTFTVILPRADDEQVAAAGSRPDMSSVPELPTTSSYPPPPGARGSRGNINNKERP